MLHEMKNVGFWTQRHVSPSDIMSCLTANMIFKKILHDDN